ncbi:hypothetical protein NBH15_00230 [Parabacteroides sp. W1-Q-101]|uniref:GumC family protein n=1 Tax=Parabacteroides caeci TaxID=2949650 RepID=UPI00202FD0A9|nr:hypothetical protein [Parabacteroides sp. W1-Q-101]MCM0716698.1 hypothetical protein [Parabacteroides sp. W1-Q-101]
MDITLYISRFLHRIRYQLILGTLVVTALVAYFTQFMQKKYTVNTSIYTGITSNTGLESESKPDWMSVNNTFDNLVNLTKSKGTLETVSMKLLALNLINGDPNVNNKYITAKNYQNLVSFVPKEVLNLIDKDSFKKTISNLEKYKQNDTHNFLYKLFNGFTPYYSYGALSQIIVKRLGNSDLIDIAYTSTDPGITLTTVKFLSEELRISYNQLKYKTADDIVKYYEDEQKRLQSQLNKLENELTDYNIKNSVINYQEQTKAIAGSFSDFENRYEEVISRINSSSQLLQGLEQYMRVRVKLVQANDEFIKALEEISKINGKITEIEIFTTENTQDDDLELLKYKEDLKNAEKKVATLTEQINNYKESKEGISIDGLVNEWLAQTIINIKAKAELKILDQRKIDFTEQYKTYSPVGTQINRQEREIHVTEESYLQVLHALNMAKMKQKNLQLTSATLNTISEPTFPLFSDKSKRLLLIIAAFAGSIIFIIGLNLIVELLDRTLRDAERTRRLTNMTVLGAFTGNQQLKYRGFIKACNRISAAYTCNRLMQYMKKGHTFHINILSIEKKEGKSFVCQYLTEYWKEIGFNVKHLVAGKDFPIDASYLSSGEISFYMGDNDRPDILLLEYPAIKDNSLPVNLLNKADINLLIANARRVWKNSDEEFVNYLHDMAQGKPLYLYLNNASRETVEDFTGQLPPETSIRSLSNRIIYMGLTARNSAIRE